MLKIVKHSEIDKKTLLDIVDIKSLSWDSYSKEQHIAWFEQNVDGEDLHFLIYDEGNLVGYLNLIKVFVDNVNEKIPFFGVGNVCTRYKGKGDGIRLMLEVGSFLENNRLRGLLFCREYLINFYRKAGWRIIKNIYPSTSVITMDYNNTYDTCCFSYSDRLF